MIVTYDFDGRQVVGKPCSNAKFMHIAGLPGMTVKTTSDTVHYEETTSVYLGEKLMAERYMETLHFPGEKSKVQCYIFDYYKGIVDDAA